MIRRMQVLLIGLTMKREMKVADSDNAKELVNFYSHNTTAIVATHFNLHPSGNEYVLAENELVP